MDFRIPFKTPIEIVEKYWHIYLDNIVYNNYNELFDLISRKIAIWKMHDAKNLVLSEKLLSIILLHEYLHEQSEQYKALMVTKVPFISGMFIGCITESEVDKLKSEIEKQEKFIEYLKIRERTQGEINAEYLKLDRIQASLSSKLKVRSLKIKMFQDEIIKYRYACAIWDLK